MKSVIAIFLIASLCASASIEQELASLTQGNSQFALNFFKNISESQEKNMFFSPFSISAALAMVYGGARGNTSKQMQAVLNFGEVTPQFERALQGLVSGLLSKAQSTGNTIEIANSQWGIAQTLPRYKTYLSTTFKTEFRTIRQFDDRTILIINKWVSDKTKGRIPSLLPAMLPPLTRYILINAIYFKSTWKVQFKAELTKPAPFKTLQGDSKTIQLMTTESTENFAYSQEQEYTAIRLPYKGDKLFMTIILPDVGKFASVKARLDGMTVTRLMTMNRTAKVKLFIPKFTLKTKYELSAVLQKMGMTDAFSQSAADLSGMTGVKDLFIAKVFHDAFVAVDEVGTEAAGATAVVIRTRSMPIIKTVRVDRPFMFIIHDDTGNNLFMGQIVEPPQ